MNIFKDKAFSNPIDTICIFDTSNLKEALLKIESYTKRYYLLGYLRYDLKDVVLGKDISSHKQPLLYFEVYDTYSMYNPPKNPLIQDIEVTPSLSYEEYCAAISYIKNEIAKGNTYQVNYTIHFDVRYNGTDLGLFEYLLQMQATPYSAFITNKYESIASFSPELFFEKKDNVIIAKPMKGTIARGVNPQDDLHKIQFLQHDPKNMAENVMIVDLLRNDLSKIAHKVETTKLFCVETHKTLHQMTSEIQAHLMPHITLFDIFCALFPCGSVTGAPKLSTMDIIDDIETHDRGVYCGAIGYMSPSEMVFSVPIRILQKDHKNNQWCYKSGGGITWDSNPFDEWQEVLLKAKFLTLEYQLIETMRVLNGKILYLQEHLERLRNSASHLGFAYKEITFPKIENGIIRVLLYKDGSYKIAIHDFKEHQNNKVCIAQHAVHSQERFLYHKTTIRPWYDATKTKIERNELYDEIFLNERNEITEGSRSNVVIEKNGILYTPPLHSGVLNGILRSVLVANKQCLEQTLYVQDLLEADKIFCINSVRGMVEVELERQ